MSQCWPYCLVIVPAWRQDIVYKTPALPTLSPSLLLLSSSKCSGSAHISEDSSEIALLLVETYQLTTSHGLRIVWEFLEPFTLCGNFLGTIVASVAYFQFVTTVFGTLDGFGHQLYFVATVFGTLDGFGHQLHFVATIFGTLDGFGHQLHFVATIFGTFDGFGHRLQVANFWNLHLFSSCSCFAARPWRRIGLVFCGFVECPRCCWTTVPSLICRYSVLSGCMLPPLIVFTLSLSVQTVNAHFLHSTA